jgi:hypothetical protein
LKKRKRTTEAAESTPKRAALQPAQPAQPRDAAGVDVTLTVTLPAHKAAAVAAAIEAAMVAEQ